MIASLPMYDWPELTNLTNAFWSELSAGFRALGVNAPEQLTRGDEHRHWHRNDLLLSQTCIYPLATELPETTIVLGTPEYAVPHCAGGQYASVLLVKRTDTRHTLGDYQDTRLAFNAENSQSGFNSLRNLLINERLIGPQKTKFFAHAIRTGSHRLSLHRVANGDADLCALDPVSWALAQRYEPRASSILRVLQITQHSPALPLICSSSSIPDKFNEEQWRNEVTHIFKHAIKRINAPELLPSNMSYIAKDDYLKLQISNFGMIPPVSIV